MPHGIETEPAGRFRASRPLFRTDHPAQVGLALDAPERVVATEPQSVGGLLIEPELTPLRSAPKRFGLPWSRAGATWAGRYPGHALGAPRGCAQSGIVEGSGCLTPACVPSSISLLEMRADRLWIVRRTGCATKLTGAWLIRHGGHRASRQSSQCRAVWTSPEHPPTPFTVTSLDRRERSKTRDVRKS